MATKIRLQRGGRKGYAFYSIVIADARAPRDGRFTEKIGTYNPNTNPATVDLNFDRALYWVETGAQPSDTVRNILSREGVYMMKHLRGGVKKGAFDEATMQKKFDAWKADKVKGVEAVRESEAKAKKDQRIYKKKFWMQNGFAHYAEAIYDGQGQVVEVVAEDTVTKFTYVPAWVIINEGLTGDLMGESEINDLESMEMWYSRLNSADMDAERQGMNEIKYTIDAAPESVKNLSIAPGAFWDLASDPNQPMDKAAQVGVLSSSMGYTSALGNTLNRLKNGLYEQAAVPNVSPEAMQGVVTSGKTLKAIYWDLIVRCDEKMLAWSDALIGLTKCIIEGAKLYPKSIAQYDVEALPEVEYDIRVENQYSLPEDEVEEKTIDLAEVTAQTMSRKRYMKKWHRLTDDEAEEELKQIALERELLEDSFAAESTPGEEVPTEENPPEEEAEEPEEEPEETPAE